MPTAAIESTPKVRRPAPEGPRMASPMTPVSPEDIARRAYELYLGRGGADGNDVEDWLMAESELLQERATRLANA